MAVPITLRCECREIHKADLGDEVTCRCGRVFDTAGLPHADLGGVYRSQLRMRLYTTIGIVFVAGISLVAAALWGFKGLAVGLPLAALVWFRIIGPSFRRRVFRGAGELPRWTLEASRSSPAEK
jgi:hypothetical protein